MVQLWRSLSFDIKRFFPLNDAWKLCMISHVIYHFYYWITKNIRNFSGLNFVCCSEFIEVPFMNFVGFAFFPNGCNRVASGFAYRSVCSVQLRQRKFPWNSCLSIHVKESFSSKSPINNLLDNYPRIFGDNYMKSIQNYLKSEVILLGVFMLFYLNSSHAHFAWISQVKL